MFKKMLKRFKRAADNEIKSDVLGSYTGVSENPYDKPQQDADDL